MRLLSATLSDTVSTIEALRCPQCAAEAARPSCRRGLWDPALALIRRYPLRCQICAHRFYQSGRGLARVFHKVERREFERLPATFQVRFWNDQLLGVGTTVDISAGGCQVCSPAPVRRDTVLEWELLPGIQPPVELRAVVVRLVQAGFGVEFLDMRGEQRQRLTVVLQQLHAAAQAKSRAARPGL